MSKGAEIGGSTARRPFYDYLGIVVEEAADGRSRVSLAGKPEISNARGDVHGGAVASLLDAAMGVAARSSLEPGVGATTVSLAVQYLEPGRGALSATGRVVRAGRSLVATEASVTDAEGVLVAHAVGTMRVLRPRKAEGA